MRRLSFFNALIGIDITSTSIRLLELGRRQGRACVKRYALCPLPAGAVVDERIHDADALARGLREAMKMSGSQCRYAAVAVPASAAWITTLRCPVGLDDTTLEAHIAAEFDRHAPFAFTDAAFDFQRLALDGPTDELPVTLAACHQHEIEALGDVLHAAGLIPAVIDIAPLALARGAALSSHLAPQALLLLEPSHSLFCVLDGGQVIHQQQAAPLTNHSNDNIALSATLGALLTRLLSLYAAHSLRQTPDMPAPGMPDEVLLAGTLAARIDVNNASLTALGVPLALSAPFAAMDVHPRLDAKALVLHAPQWVMAVGLAARRPM